MYENPKCTHAFILHSFYMIKSLPIVSILYHFGSLMNFQIYTWDSLSFKPINHSTMVCYHQNRIWRTLELTLSFQTEQNIHKGVICQAFLWVFATNSSCHLRRVSFTIHERVQDIPKMEKRRVHRTRIFTQWSKGDPPSLLQGGIENTCLPMSTPSFEVAPKLRLYPKKPPKQRKPP